ncbi:MAG: Txe/YoeB family addiction module toxin [Chloroflexota bacterium]|nr:MAG: Txe/YoeB family addiction module toxin [Chloroflexota bacterium]
MSERRAILAPYFVEDLTFWIKNDRKVALRVKRLMDAALRDPFVGEGKPEPLKRLGPNHWSRRITDEHRLVYEVSASAVYFLQGRYHY